MFFIIFRALLWAAILGICVYSYVTWVKDTALKSEVQEAIKEIDGMLEVHKDIPNHKTEKVRMARKRLERLLNTKGVNKK